MHKVGTQSPEVKSSRYILLAGATAMTLANLGAWAMPVITGTLIDTFAFTELEAGVLISTEMVAMASASLLTAMFLSRVPLRVFAFVGLSIAAAGHALTAEFQMLFPIALCRMIAGIGEGTLYAAGCATVSRLSDPDRAFALAMIIQGLVAAAVLAILPVALDAFGGTGLFLSLSLLTLLLSPILRFLPGKHLDQQSSPANEIKSDKAVSLLPGIMLMAGMVLVATMEMSMWPNIERLGARLHMSMQSIGFVLSASTIVGTLGGLAAAALSTKFGRIIPISAGLIVQFLSGALCIFAESPLLYIIGFMCWSFGLFFLYPYLFGTASTFDSIGRWAAAGSGMLVSGQIIGPVLSGYIVHYRGYAGLFWILLVFSLTSFFLLMYSIKLSRPVLYQQTEITQR